MENAKKYIAVMLDVEGTCDNINKGRAGIFLQQLEKLRQKMKADFVAISVSTLSYSTTKIRKILDYIKDASDDKIVIADSFVIGGIYNYDKDQVTSKGVSFNSNKVDTFVKYHRESSKVYECVWYGFFDDELNEKECLKYQNDHLLLIGRPSCGDVDRNRFNRIASPASCFDGVIDIMNQYLENIKRKSLEQILERQQVLNESVLLRKEM